MGAVKILNDLDKPRVENEADISVVVQGRIFPLTSRYSYKEFTNNKLLTGKILLNLKEKELAKIDPIMLPGVTSARERLELHRRGIYRLVELGLLAVSTQITHAFRNHKYDRIQIEIDRVKCITSTFDLWVIPTVMAAWASHTMNFDLRQKDLMIPGMTSLIYFNYKKVEHTNYGT